MKNIVKQLFAEEAGFIVSAELVLIATLLVIGLVVGLSEVQHAVVSELNDVSEGIGSLNQSYLSGGFYSVKNRGQIKAFTVGSAFLDRADDCDNNECDLACGPAAPEAPKSR